MTLIEIVLLKYNLLNWHLLKWPVVPPARVGWRYKPEWAKVSTVGHSLSASARTLASFWLGVVFEWWRSRARCTSPGLCRRWRRCWVQRISCSCYRSQGKTRIFRRSSASQWPSSHRWEWWGTGRRIFARKPPVRFCSTDRSRGHHSKYFQYLRGFQHYHLPVPDILVVCHFSHAIFFI